MKGVIFTITEKFITETYGEDKFEEIIESCDLITKQVFVSPGTYPDADLIQIVGRASEKLNMTVPEFLKAMGHYMFFELAEGAPQFVTPYKHPKEFLKTVEYIIHVEVKKMYEDSRPPSFTYTEPKPDMLTITYFSERKLYALMEGLIDGVGEYFKTPIAQKHRIYEKNGHEVCDFELTFSNHS